jgi:hypothetical protein
VFSDESIAETCHLPGRCHGVVWRDLTHLPIKRDLFRNDCYFREAADSVLALPLPAVRTFLRSYTLFMLKPDALVARKGELAVRAVEALGFDPVWARPVRLSRRGMRELWRFSWSEAAIERIRLSTLLNAAAPAVCMVLRRRKDQAIPASVQLALAKGSATPERRTREHIRTILGSPNGILSFIHCADEPADMLRELAVFFDPEVLESVFEVVLGDLAPDRGAVLSAIREAETGQPFCDMDVPRCVRDVWARLPREEHASEIQNRARYNGVSHDASDHFSKLMAFVRQTESPVWFWEAVCAASAFLPPDPFGAKPLIPNDSYAGWENRSTDNS